jgi:hypothetical protein
MVIWYGRKKDGALTARTMIYLRRYSQKEYAGRGRAHRERQAMEMVRLSVRAPTSDLLLLLVRNHCIISGLSS